MFVCSLYLLPFDKCFPKALPYKTTLYAAKTHDFSCICRLPVCIFVLYIQIVGILCFAVVIGFPDLDVCQTAQ